MCYLLRFRELLGKSFMTAWYTVYVHIPYSEKVSLNLDVSLAALVNDDEFMHKSYAVSLKGLEFIKHLAIVNIPT